MSQKGTRKCHEELTETAAHHDIGVEETIVAKDEPHEAASQEPLPHLGASIHRVGLAASPPKHDAEQHDSNEHTPDVEHQSAHAFACHLGKECREGPHHGDKQGKQFAAHLFKVVPVEQLATLRAEHLVFVDHVSAIIAAKRLYLSVLRSLGLLFGAANFFPVVILCFHRYCHLQGKDTIFNSKFKIV